MQSVLSRIWTRVVVFISYDDKNYTTGTSANSVGEELNVTDITEQWFL